MKFTVGETEEPEENEGIQIPAQIEEALQQPEIQSQVLQVAQEQGIPPALLKAFIPGSDFGPEDMQKALSKNANEAQATQAPEEPKPGIPAEERGINAENNLTEEKPDMPETTKTETEEVAQSFTADDMKKTVNSLIDYFSEDMTLKELKEFIEENPDLVNTALEIEGL